MIIDSANIKIFINAEEKVIKSIKESDFSYNYIPVVKLSEKKANKTNYVLKIIDSARLKFNFTSQVAELYCQLGVNINIKDIITVIDYCLEYLRQKEDLYCFHGSAVSNLNTGVLFLGGVSGLGKTTLATNLCLQKDFKFIGDEKILINKNLDILGGVKHILYNKSALELSIPVNLNGISNRKLSKEIRIEEQIVPLQLIIQPMIANGTKRLEVEKWSELKTSFHLYEDVTRKIRGVSRRINNFTYPLSSIDSQFIAMKRSDFINKISKQIKAYTIKGSLEAVMVKVVNLLQER